MHVLIPERRCTRRTALGYAVYRRFMYVVVSAGSSVVRRVYAYCDDVRAGNVASTHRSAAPASSGGFSATMQNVGEFYAWPPGITVVVTIYGDKLLVVVDGTKSRTASTTPAADIRARDSLNRNLNSSVLEDWQPGCLRCTFVSGAPG